MHGELRLLDPPQWRVSEYDSISGAALVVDDVDGWRHPMRSNGTVSIAGRRKRGILEHPHRPPHG
jgi:hypothetical protein